MDLVDMYSAIYDDSEPVDIYSSISDDLEPVNYEDTILVWIYTKHINFSYIERLSFKISINSIRKLGYEVECTSSGIEPKINRFCKSFKAKVSLSHLNKLCPGDWTFMYQPLTVFKF